MYRGGCKEEDAQQRKQRKEGGSKKDGGIKIPVKGNDDTSPEGGRAETTRKGHVLDIDADASRFRHVPGHIFVPRLQFGLKLHASGERRH